MISDVEQRSKMLADAVDEKRRVLGLSWAELRSATGLSSEGFMNVRKGMRRQYQERTTIGHLKRATRRRIVSASRHPKSRGPRIRSKP